MLFTPSYSPAITLAGPAKWKSEAPRYWLWGSASSSSGRHRDPELKALDPLLAEHSAGMPNAAAGAHPLNTAGLDDAFAAGGLLVERLPGQNDGQSRNSRMGMKAEFWRRRWIGVEVVEKDERLDPFANVARTDQPGNAPMRVSTRAQSNLPGTLFSA